MKFDNSFTVSAPPDVAWRVILDVPSIAPCFPGATLLEQVDPNIYKGMVSVKLGPLALSFKGSAQIVERDEAGKAVLVRASGADTKGRGQAKADARFVLTAIPNGTRVTIFTDLALTGSVAQYGRGAMLIQEVAAGLIEQFERNLNARFSGGATQVEGSPVAVTTPSGSIGTGYDNSIGMGLIWRIFKRLVRRLVERPV